MGCKYWAPTLAVKVPDFTYRRDASEKGACMYTLHARKIDDPPIRDLTSFSSTLYQRSDCVRYIYVYVNFFFKLEL